ncbi:13119_t:CDS:2, partial [Dentiscutata heterogama]
MEFFQSTQNLNDLNILNWLIFQKDFPEKYDSSIIAINDYQQEFSLFYSSQPEKKTFMMGQLRHDKQTIVDNWDDIQSNIVAHRKFLEIEKKFNSERETPWQQILLKHNKHNAISDTQLDSINEEYYLIVDNPASRKSDHPSNEFVSWLKDNVNTTEHAPSNIEEPWLIEFINADESFTDSSYEAGREASREASTRSRSRSSSRQPSSRSSISQKEDLIFVNYNADDFSDEAGKSNLGVRPDGQFLCSNIKYAFRMEVGALESSRPINSPQKKKQKDGSKLIMIMLIAGSHVRESFDPKYMSKDIQGLLEQIEYVTLQAFNEKLI